ncbi:MAG: STAS domain-containing protein [Candidatus Sumerlaeota bacterium]|nr:STAS domain-containing protein [Candidatus Sumerlaeota bacterium]
MKKDDVVILVIKGRLDALTSPELSEKISKTIAGGVTKLILDLKNLDYISSAGVRVIYCAWNEIDDKQGKLALAAPNQNIKRVFDMVDLSSDFPIFDDVDEALKHL